MKTAPVGERPVGMGRFLQTDRPVLITCPDCNGSTVCGACHGDGYIEHANARGRIRLTCRACKGSAVCAECRDGLIAVDGDGLRLEFDPAFAAHAACEEK